MDLASSALYLHIKPSRKRVASHASMLAICVTLTAAKTSWESDQYPLREGRSLFLFPRKRGCPSIQTALEMEHTRRTSLMFHDQVLVPGCCSRRVSRRFNLELAVASRRVARLTFVMSVWMSLIRVSLHVFFNWRDILICYFCRPTMRSDGT
jgi:hypothetical protein